MGSFERLAGRWADLAGESAADLARDARDRVARYPALVRAVFAFVPLLVEWFGPVLALGRPGRASRLRDADFDLLLARLCDHRSSLVRSVFMLWRLPLAEHLDRGATPARRTHPLEGVGPPAGDKFDVVVVGSGAGGAPLAWSLARRGLAVAVVEAGTLAHPAPAPEAMERYYLQQGFVVSLAGGMIPVLAGQAVGGTTVINSGTCLRPPADRLEAWDRQAGTDFASGALEPYLDEIERLLPVTVPDRSLLGTSNLLIEEGLRRLGRHETYVLPRNAPGCAGAGQCCFVCPEGAKLSTDRSFLPDAVAHGCALLAGTRATRIRERKGGVEVEVTGKRLLRCRHLVLAAGPFGTPALLRRNRLGTSWALAGSHLRIHPASKAFAHFADVRHRAGGVPQGLGYACADMPRLNFEGIQTPPGVAAQIMPLAGERQRWWLSRYDHVSSFGMSVQDRGTGRIFLAGGHPQIWYRLDPQDARDLGEGLLLVARAFFAAGADRVLLPAVGLPNELGNVKELDRLQPEDFTPGNLMCAGFHPQGTAGIGRVVDGDLRLRGCERISVVDASVFPDSPRINPQITIMALSLRLADRLARDLGR